MFLDAFLSLLATMCWGNDDISIYTSILLKSQPFSASMVIWLKSFRTLSAAISVWLGSKYCPISSSCLHYMGIVKLCRSYSELFSKIFPSSSSYRKWAMVSSRSSIYSFFRSLAFFAASLLFSLLLSVRSSWLSRSKFFREVHLSYGKITSKA